MTSMTGRIWLDSGRLIMVPSSAVFLLFDGFALVHGGRGSRGGGSGGGGGGGALQWFTTALVCAFYALIIWGYLRRGPAIATGRAVTAHAAAVVAMLAPFAVPLLRATPPGAAAQWAGDMLLAVGTGWSVWSLRSLGRSLSVIAQARKLVVGGPYRWVRHPLYTGEIVSSLGLAITVGGLAALAVWLGFCVLQGYRALREEQLLVRALPGYRDYQARTAALLPGLFLSWLRSGLVTFWPGHGKREPAWPPLARIASRAPPSRNGPKLIALRMLTRRAASSARLATADSTKPRMAPLSRAGHPSHPSTSPTRPASLMSPPPSCPRPATPSTR